MQPKTLTPLLLLSTLLPLSPAIAQLIPDTTLGTEASTVNPTTLDGLPTDLIEGGATRGQHLFHSFREFNVNEAQRVYFANPVGIENILSRVTGNNISHILGTLGVNGNANLYLINPNGIIFGENATLDIRGSFTATTVESILFDNYEFSATNPDAPPLLTLNITPGIQYPENEQGKITNQGHLEVGEDLTLLSNNLDLEGQIKAGNDLTLMGTDNVKIRDSEDHPFIAAAENELLIQGNQTVDIFALNHPDSGLFSGGDMILRSTDTVNGDAHYYAKGNFQIEQLDGSLGNLSSPHDPIIYAVDNVSFNAYRGQSLHILAGGSVNIAQYIWITGTGNASSTLNETITLSNGDSLNINGSAEPTVDIRAGVDWTQLGGLSNNNAIGVSVPPSIFSPNSTSADINVGTIFFNNATLTSAMKGAVVLTNQYYPNQNLSGNITVNATVIGGPLTGQEAIVTGDAFQGGSVFLDSKNDVNINGDIGALALNFSGNYFGNGGNITILAQNNINNNARIVSRGLQGGAITLNSGRSMILSNNVQSVSHGSLTGTGADVSLVSPSLLIRNGAFIGTITYGNINAGNLFINARDFVKILGTSTDGSTPSALFSQTEGNGDAGNINVNTNELIIKDGGRLTAFTTSNGNAGDIVIDDTKFVEVSGSSSNGLLNSNIRNDQVRSGAGSGGNLTINTEEFIIQGGGQVGSGTWGTGNGGTVTIHASESLQVIGVGSNQNRSSLAVENHGEGDASKLYINTEDLIIQNGGVISSATNGGGNGGELRINASNIELLGKPQSGEVSSIFADVKYAGLGQGGNLYIEAEQLTLEDYAEITTGALGLGDGGNMSLKIEKLYLNNHAFIFSGTVQGGNAGHINIVTEQLNLQNDSHIVSGVGRSIFLGLLLGEGRGGNITINTQELLALSGSTIFAGTNGSGDAGNILINASDQVEFSGSVSNSVLVDSLGDRGIPSGIISNSVFGTSNAGHVTLNTPNLRMTEGAGILTTTTESGRAGDINIQATNRIELIGTSPNGQRNTQIAFDTKGSGNAGILRVSTPQLILREGAAIIGTTQGTGQGGILDVNASDSIEINGTSGEFASGLFFDSTGAGDAGQLNVNTRQLSVQNGGQISASTSNLGQGGVMNVRATDSITVDGTSGQFTSGLYFDSRGPGDARGISLNTNRLDVQNGGTITVSGSGTGKSGNLDINAGAVYLTNQGSLRATTSASEGGNLNLNVAENILLRYNSEISAEALGQSNGGNINMNVGGFIVGVLHENSDIVANAYEGEGGTINATAKGIFGFRQFVNRRTPESDFTASSALGIDGTVNLNINDYQPNTPFPENPNVPQLSQGCQRNPNTPSSEDTSSEFYVTGNGGIPISPEDSIHSHTTPPIPWMEEDDGELEYNGTTEVQPTPNNPRFSTKNTKTCYPLH